MASSLHRKYVIISPCRNEAEFMRETLESVVKQTIKPQKWVIVDDGSIDETSAILSEYADNYFWISVVTRENRGHRAVGPGVIDAFYAGYETIKIDDYDYVCKLDLDLRLPESYFETLILRMEQDVQIATCSGKAYIEVDGNLVNERHGDDTSIGATKFYRVSAFKVIGGFVREVMWDGIDCHLCRMNGYKACSWDDPELRFIHLRPEGSSQKSIYSGKLRQGYGQYFMGTSFIYLFASSVYRLNEKPYVIGSILKLWGWISAALQRKARYQNPVFRKFLRRYHYRVLVVGKKRALDELHNSV